MYNPFPPVAGGAVGLLAVTGVNALGLAIFVILAVVGGLVVVRTVQLKNRAIEKEEGRS